MWAGGDVNKPTSTLMERMVGEQTIPYSSPVYKLGRDQYQNNLRDIAKTLAENGVRMLISDLVSNVRDMPPFVSVESDSFPSAEAVYAEAQMLERQGDFTAARKKFLLAKDLDGLRFRATEDFNAVIRAVAAEFEVPVVPVKQYFEDASPNGMVGNNLMLEHLHPQAEGYFLMADAFFDAMRVNGFINDVWDSRAMKPPEYYRQNWGFTDLDRSYADIRIRILKGNWPFIPKSAPNRALIDYRPGTKADSIALKVWLEKDVNLERGHVELAEFYEKQHNYSFAFEEYRALTCLTPFNSSAYLHAADMLIKARELSSAVGYLKSSLELGETAFANKWLGQILLDEGRTDSALTYLESAGKMTPSDPQLIYNLSGAYALVGQYDKARAFLEKLDRLRPNFPGAADLKRQLEKL